MVASVVDGHPCWGADDRSDHRPMIRVVDPEPESGLVQRFGRASFCWTFRARFSISVGGGDPFVSRRGPKLMDSRRRVNMCWRPEEMPTHADAPLRGWLPSQQLQQPIERRAVATNRWPACLATGLSVACI